MDRKSLIKHIQSLNLGQSYVSLKKLSPKDITNISLLLKKGKTDVKIPSHMKTRSKSSTSTNLIPSTLLSPPPLPPSDSSKNRKRTKNPMLQMLSPQDIKKIQLSLKKEAVSKSSQKIPKKFSKSDNNNNMMMLQPKVVLQKLPIYQKNIQLPSDLFEMEDPDSINKEKKVNMILGNIYHDLTNTASYSSPWEVYKQSKDIAKKAGIKITLKMVERWLSTQRPYSMYKNMHKKFKRRKVLVRGMTHQYQADLLDFSGVSPENDGNHFILTVIDCFSRYATAIPVKNKKGATVAVGLQKAFKEMGLPKKLQTDYGGEFKNKELKSILDKLKIIRFTTDQTAKAQMVERFNGTIRRKLHRYMVAQNSLRYIDVLPIIIDTYNKTPHGSFKKKYAPIDVNKDNEKEIRHILYFDYLTETPREHLYSIGDTVRIPVYKTSMKRLRKTYREELFEIVDTLKTNPPTYRVANKESRELIDGCFYEEELQKIYTKNKKIKGSTPKLITKDSRYKKIMN